MEISFRSKELERCYVSFSFALRRFGRTLADRYVRRINILRNSPNVPSLIGLPGLRCHPLKGRRAGQWVVSLDEFHRLVFTVKDERMEIIEIQEVSKHYGD